MDTGNPLLQHNQVTKPHVLAGWQYHLTSVPGKYTRKSVFPSTGVDLHPTQCYCASQFPKQTGDPDSLHNIKIFLRTVLTALSTGDLTVSHHVCLGSLIPSAFTLTANELQFLGHARTGTLILSAGLHQAIETLILNCWCRHRGTLTPSTLIFGTCQQDLCFRMAMTGP